MLELIYKKTGEFKENNLSIALRHNLKLRYTTPLWQYGEEIKTAHLVEAVLLNCVMLFAKNPGELNTELSITVNGEGEFDYYIADNP